MSGIEHVKLSPDGLKGSFRRLMESSGMAEAVQASGAELHFFEEAGWDAFYEETPTAGDCRNGSIMMPKSEKDGFLDTTSLMVGCGNRYVVTMLGGLGPALSSERLIKDNINTIWDDRILNHAYCIFGGVPQVIIERVGNLIPDDLNTRLGDMTTLPG